MSFDVAAIKRHAPRRALRYTVGRARRIV